MIPGRLSALPFTNNVDRLRDQLGVKLDFNDEPDEKEKEGKKKKVLVQKSKVKVRKLSFQVRDCALIPSEDHRQERKR